MELISIRGILKQEVVCNSENQASFRERAVWTLNNKKLQHRFVSGPRKASKQKNSVESILHSRTIYPKHECACSALLFQARPGNTMDAWSNPNSLCHTPPTRSQDSFAAKKSSPKLVANAETI
eukprot:3213083-Amphidinium_carterae.1